MNLKQIIKEEIEDFNWMKQVSDDLIPGQKYFIKSGNNWDVYEFVEYDPEYDYEYDHNEYTTMEVYKFKQDSGTSMMSKSHIEDLKSKGLVRIYEEDFSFESLFNWGPLNDIEGRSFAIYFRDGIQLNDTLPIQKKLFEMGFKFWGTDSYLTNEIAEHDKDILLIESINWDTKHKSGGIYPYAKMDPKQRDKKLLLFVGYPDGMGWRSTYSEHTLRREIERNTNELVHHNAVVIDGHKLLKELKNGN
jgi:hypothetical protein